MIKKDWKTRNFEVSDLSRIAAFRKVLQQSMYSSRRSIEHEYFEWKLINNPAKKGIFCFVEDNGEIISQLSVTPKLMRLRNKTILGSELGDAITHSNYQRQGLFSHLLRETRDKAVNAGIELIYGQSNERSFPGESKAGYNIIPNFGLKHYIRVINIKKILNIKIKNSFVLEGVSRASNTILKNYFSLKKYKDYKSRYDIERVNIFNDDMSSFFENVSNDYEVLIVRDKKYLNWRFIENPDAYNIYIASQKSHIVGYIVTKIGYYMNLKIGFIADFLTMNDDEIFTDLISIALKDFHSEDVDLISCWAMNRTIYSKCLLRKAFIPYTSIPFIVYKNNLGEEIIRANYKWHFTMADSDNI